MTSMNLPPKHLRYCLTAYVTVFTSFLVAAVLISAIPAAAQQPCGGVERWAVKMAADVNSQINLQPIPISIHDLANIQKPASMRPRARTGQSNGFRAMTARSFGCREYR